MRRNVIIDCDPGHDDAIAIIVALANSEKLNVLGITTVAGNTTLDNATKNALRALRNCRAWRIRWRIHLRDNSQGMPLCSLCRGAVQQPCCRLLPLRSRSCIFLLYNCH